jgi:hypothetical protein
MNNLPFNINKKTELIESTRVEVISLFYYFANLKSVEKCLQKR